ncbi:hypothetical protein ACFQBQ_01250 [Granulicella cerasi]|uniref:Peptidase C51 domain-containing protein n=1 Tax=Granulicella cerasi TaxID=741063 RepID=A0ABW1Z4C6_9BACT|nr:hypothetical protein [Granulicella cerasi]
MSRTAFAQENAPEEKIDDKPTVMASEMDRFLAKDCCGPITPGGQQLLQVLDAMDVERLWPQHMHVNWKTGWPDGVSHGNHSTHCSAFAAAVGDRLDVYMLRPPDHSQSLLASAQGRWFGSAAGRRDGWKRVSTWDDAQRFANQGQLVVVDYINPNHHAPGHIAIVRPAMKTFAQLKEEGPETTQAGATNFRDGNTVRSFARHTGAWPHGLVVYAHETRLSRGDFGKAQIVPAALVPVDPGGSVMAHPVDETALKLHPAPVERVGQAANAIDATKTGCCGPITDAGWQLIHALDSMDVEHHWLADRHVEWKSGDPTSEMLTDGKPHTHCSAFAASAGMKLDVYMLRPPDHGELYLASAQGKWFTTDDAAAKGWVKVVTAKEAQERANRGELVVLDYVATEAGKHGHIAIVRPAVKTDEQLAADGPETIQAGQTNFADGNAVKSFKSHPGAWPAKVLMYAHPTKLAAQ